MLYLVGQWDFDYIFFTESDQVSIDDNGSYDADDDGTSDDDDDDDNDKLVGTDKSNFSWDTWYFIDVCIFINRFSWIACPVKYIDTSTSILVM